MKTAAFEIAPFSRERSRQMIRESGALSVEERAHASASATFTVQGSKMQLHPLINGLRTGAVIGDMVPHDHVPVRAPSEA